MLLLSSIHGKLPFKSCSANNLNLPLQILPEMEGKSKLFKTMPKDVRNILLTEPVTANYHMYVYVLFIVLLINCCNSEEFKLTELSNFKLTFLDS